MWWVWPLCNGRKAVLQSIPCHSSPMTCLSFAPCSCGLCFSHVCSFNANYSGLGKQPMSVCSPQVPQFPHGIMVLKCCHWKGWLCELVLLVEEARSAVRYDTHPCTRTRPITMKTDTANCSNQTQMFSNNCLFFILFALHLQTSDALFIIFNHNLCIYNLSI